MDIEISVEKGKIIIQLKNSGKIIDSALLKEENNLSKTLLPNIDILLKKNGIKKEKIKKISVKKNNFDFYTSNRIAQSLAKSFNFAKKIA